MPDDKVERFLRIAERAGALDEAEQPEQLVNDGERFLVRQAAAEATVLLKNDNAAAAEPGLCRSRSP